MFTVNRGLAGPQDPMFGLSPDNVTDRLTPENWQKKAVVRIGQEGWIYLWVHSGTERSDGGDEIERFYVDATGRGARAAEWRAVADALEDALEFANGDEGTPLAEVTRPASAGEWQVEEGQTAFVDFQPAQRTASESLSEGGHDV